MTECPRALAVLPIADYEPPPRPVVHPRPRPVRRRSRRSTEPPGPRPAVGGSPEQRAAAGFADAALRRVLEVIDRRRPLIQLHGLLIAGLVDSVLSVRRCAPGGGAAVLRRVRVQAVGPAAAEVFGTYSRGRRVHAVAGRVERVPGPDGPRWRVVALHIG